MGLRFFLPLLLLCFPVAAQENLESINLYMETEVMLGEEQVWAHALDHELQNGDPANFRFTGDNFKMVVRVTAVHLNDEMLLLVVQSETLLQNSEGQVNFYSNMRSTQLPANQPVLYYPLGGASQAETQEAMMRFILILNPQGDVHQEPALD